MILKKFNQLINDVFEVELCYLTQADLEFKVNLLRILNAGITAIKY